MMSLFRKRNGQIGVETILIASILLVFALVIANYLKSRGNEQMNKMESDIAKEQKG